MTLSVRLAECMMRVWRQDWCQHWTTSVWRCGCGAPEQHTHSLIQRLSRTSVIKAQQTWCKPSSPPPPPPGRRQSHLLVLGWTEGTFPDYIYCDTACVCVNAGRVFLSDSCTLSNPWQQRVLSLLQIIIILELGSFFNTAEGLLWLNLWTFSGFVIRREHRRSLVFMSFCGAGDKILPENLILGERVDSCTRFCPLCWYIHLKSWHFR